MLRRFLKKNFVDGRFEPTTHGTPTPPSRPLSYLDVELRASDVSHLPPSKNIEIVLCVLSNNNNNITKNEKKIINLYNSKNFSYKIRVHSFR